MIYTHCNFYFMDNQQISNNKIRQVFFIIIIIVLLMLIFFNLSEFLPSLLGAVTLYIIFRKFYLKLTEEKKWKPWLAAIFLMFISIVVIVLPVYFLGQTIVQKLDNISQYKDGFNDFLDKIHQYIYSKLDIDILSKENKQKIGSFITKYSANILNSTFNIFTVVFSAYFILYFLLTNMQLIERYITKLVPLKNANIHIIGEKFQKMVIANAVGIPVVALGQALVALIGYYIFGAPSPILLFALTFIGSMIPIVGAAIIYVPVGIFMMANGDMFGGVGTILYGVVIVGLVDNVFRFTFLKKLDNIHPLNTVFGIILGLKLFGFMGLIFGPILVSMTFLLIKVYMDEFSDKEIGKKDEHQRSKNVKHSES